MGMLVETGSLDDAHLGLEAQVGHTAANLCFQCQGSPIKTSWHRMK